MKSVQTFTFRLFYIWQVLSGRGESWLSITFSLCSSFPSTPLIRVINVMNCSQIYWTTSTDYPSWATTNLVSYWWGLRHFNTFAFSLSCNVFLFHFEGNKTYQWNKRIKFIKLWSWGQFNTFKLIFIVSVNGTMLEVRVLKQWKVFERDQLIAGCIQDQLFRHLLHSSKIIHQTYLRFYA